MYLHIGNEVNIRIKDIVGIYDMDSATVSQNTKEFLRRAEKEGRTVYASADLPKTFILTADNTVHFSPIAVSSLLGRLTASL